MAQFPIKNGLIQGTLDGTPSGGTIDLSSVSKTLGAIGTPSSGTLTNCTGLPIATGISGLGSGVATFLGSYLTSSATNRISVVGVAAAESLRLAGTSGGGCYLQTFSASSAYMTQSAYYNGTSWVKTGTGSTAVLFGAFNGSIKLYINSGISGTDGTTFTPTERLGLDVTGLLTLTGNLVTPAAIITTPQSLSGAGAVDVTSSATAYTSTGTAQALTLANGTAGQIKTICHVVDGGSGVLTPTTKSGYTTITFTNAGDSVTLQFHTTAGWCIIGSYGVTIA